MNQSHDQLKYLRNNFACVVIERLHLHISFIDFYREVICYSLTNFSRSTANYMWSTKNLFLVFNLEISWPRWLTKQYKYFFFTNFAWKTSLDLIGGKHLCLIKHLTTSIETRIMSPREWATKTSFSLQPLVTESCLGRCDLVLSPLFMSTNMAAVTSADVSSH